MCGIAGFIGEDNAKMQRMVDVLAHRGPDGTSVQVTTGGTLGHARLAILDPRPIGDQPMWDEEKTVAIVYNGEVFNFKSLRESEKLQVKTGTDTEVLLLLYKKYGIDFVKKLKGMFAFGIYDTKNKTWYLARDTSGIKPLYVSYIGGTLHFASELRALLSVMPKKPPLNMCALSQYIRLQYIPGPETICEGIQSVPPGTILVAGPMTTTSKAFVTDQEPVRYESKNDFSGNFPKLFDEVVADHMVSDKPIGMFLSGGIDSSSVLHHMQAHSKEPVKTFTVRFEVDVDEERFNADANLARQTAEHYKTDHREVVLSGNLAREIFKETAKFLDQPNSDAVSRALFVLSREAKKHVDVVLTGAGGDELFGGYPRYRIAKILHALRMIPAPVRGILGTLSGQPSDVLSLSPGPKLAERLLARPQKEIRSIVRGNWYQEDAVAKTFTKWFDRLPGEPLRQFMEFDRHVWLVDESLRLTDAVTMASGLEARVPFLDPRVIAASIGTKSEWHVSSKRTKCLLKDTYLPILPAHLSSLQKSSFYPPLAKWIRKECAPLIEEMFEHPRIKELFNVEELKRLFELHKSGGYALHPLANVLQLACWFDAVYDA